MTSQDTQSLSNSERLASIQGEAKLDGVPCRGMCTTTYGDLSCGTCGRSQEEITNWNTYYSQQKKLINIRNAANGFKIRKLEMQDVRWMELRNMKTNIDQMSMKDVLKKIVVLAGSNNIKDKNEMKCLDAILSIVSSDHKFNELSIASILSEDAIKKIKEKYEQ